MGNWTDSGEYLIRTNKVRGKLDGGNFEAEILYALLCLTVYFAATCSKEASVHWCNAVTFI